MMTTLSHMRRVLGRNLAVQVLLFSTVCIMLVHVGTHAAVVPAVPPVLAPVAVKPAPVKAPVIPPPVVAPVVSAAPKIPPAVVEAPLVAPVVATAPKTAPVLPPVAAAAPAKTAPVPASAGPLASPAPVTAGPVAAGPAVAAGGALDAKQLAALKDLGMTVGPNACAVESPAVLTCDPTSHLLTTLSVQNCPATATLSPTDFEAIGTASLTHLSFVDCGVQAPSAAPSVGFASSLQDLFLVDSFTGVFGWWLGRFHALKNLTVIDVAITTDSGLDVIVSNMDSLEYLTITNSSLPGKLPTTWPTTLISIQLAGNSISGGIPSSIGSLTTLTKLDLSYNQLNGSVPTELGKLPLTYVDFSNNTELSGPLPFSTETLSSMKTLKVGGTAICYDPSTITAKLAHSFSVPVCGGLAPALGPALGPSSAPTPGPTPEVPSSTHKKKPKLIVIVIAAAAALVVLSAIIYCCCRWWGAREGYH
ncbi:unnamed protein product [Sphagnum compactum]